MTKVLSQTAEYVGRTICQLNLLLNPELVVIAGPLAELDRTFLQPVREIVERLTPQLHGRVPRIVASEVGEFGGALEPRRSPYTIGAQPDMRNCAALAAFTGSI